MEGLGAIPDLAFVNTTVMASPGDELRLINETQRGVVNVTPTPSLPGIPAP